MKRILSSILALSMILALVPMGGSVFAAPAYTQDEYYYEDLTGFAGNPHSMEMRYNKQNAAYVDVKAKSIATDKFGTGLYWYDTANSAFTPNPNGNPDKSGAMFNVKIGHSSFEQKPGAAILFSTDLFVPVANITEKTFNNYILMSKADGTTLKYVSALPKFEKSGNNMYFSGRNSTNASENTWGVNQEGTPAKMLYAPTQDAWVNLATLMTFETVEGKDYYVSRFFVNGQPILANDGQPAVYKQLAKGTPQNNINSTPLSLAETDYKLVMNFEPRAGASATASSGGFILDNFSIRLYSSLTVAETASMTVGNTTAEVPIYNGYAFANPATVPTYVKGGMADASTIIPSNFTIEKIAKSDKLMLNRTPVTGFGVTAENGKLVFSNLPAMTETDILRITYKNLKAIDGKAVADGTVILTSDGVYTDPTNIEFFDIAGTNKYPENANEMPLDVIKIKVDTDKAVTLEGSNGRNYTGVAGVLDFSAMVLESGATYTLKLDGSAYASFTTSADGSIACSPLTYESGAIKGNIHNSTSDTANYTLAVMGMNSSGDVISVTTYPLPIAELSITPINKIVSGAASYKAVIWGDTTTFKPMVAQMVEKTTETSTETKTKASIFDNDRKMTIEGKLAAASRLSVVLYNEAEDTIVYADDVNTADGSYKYTLTIPEAFATGTYKLTITDGTNIIVDSLPIYYAKASENKAAIGADGNAADTVNGAASGADLASVISTNQAKLEFYYDGYYDQMDATEQADVATILYNDLNPTGEGAVKQVLDDDDKPAAVNAFRRAVLAKAAEKGLISDFNVLEEYYPELLTDPFRKWMNTSGRTAVVRATPATQPVSAEIMQTWQSGALDRLKDVDFTSTDDFVAKLQEAALLECVELPDGYGNIQTMVADYKTAGYLTASTSKLTGSVASQLVGKNFANYTELFDEIDRLYVPAPVTPEPPRGDGIKVPVSTNPKDDKPAEPVTPATPTEPVKGLSDISGSWAKEEIQKLYDAGIVAGNGNGKYEPERSIAREEFVAIACRVLDLKPILDSALPFEDIAKDSWEHEYIRAAYQNGIINGVSDVKFGKGANISRQDMAVILENILFYKKLQVETTALDFIDSGLIADYAKDSVAKMVKMGVINGYADNSFGPERPATRAEMAAMINRFLEFVENAENSDTDTQE